MTNKTRLGRRNNCPEFLEAGKGRPHGRPSFFVGIITLLTMITLVLSLPAQIRGEQSFSEDEIKAAFLYKFLLFIDWPEEAFPEEQNTITIGIYDFEGLAGLFDGVEGISVLDRKLVIRQFEPEANEALFKKCQLLFIGSSMAARIPVILNSLQGLPIVTAGETSGFLEQGGMVNFLSREGSVNFEINKSSAAEVGIKFRSKLLRVADRIVVDIYAD